MIDKLVYFVFYEFYVKIVLVLFYKTRRKGGVFMKNSIVKFLSLILAGVLTLSGSTFAFAEDSPGTVDGFAVALNPERNYLILVNNENPYEFGGEYDESLREDLVFLADAYGEATPLEKATALAFSQLQIALKVQGMEIVLYSAYRTEADQAWVYENFGELEGWSETNLVAKPGFSEHHTGLVVEVMVFFPDENGDIVPQTVTAERHDAVPFFALLDRNLANFGFILRYPEGKEEWTGAPSMPYEIRLVGSSKIAHEIMDNGLCLEEYLAQK